MRTTTIRNIDHPLKDQVRKIYEMIQAPVSAPEYDLGIELYYLFKKENVIGCDRSNFEKGSEYRITLTNWSDGQIDLVRGTIAILTDRIIGFAATNETFRWTRISYSRILRWEKV